MRLSGRLGVLEERQFRVFFFGQLSSLLGDLLVPVALAFAVLDLTGSATDLGLVLAAGTVPMVVFLLAGGVWADRLSRRRVMLTADLVRFAAQATAAALIIGGDAEVWHLVATQVVRGTASAFFMPASTGILPQLVSGPRLQEANALRGLSESAAQLTGPVVSGLLVVGVGPGWAIAIDALTFLVSAGFLAALRPLEHERAAPSHFLDDLLHGWREFSSRTWLWVIVAEFAVLHLVAMGPFVVLGPLVAKEELGGAAAWSAILAGSGIGAVAGGILALRVRPRRPLYVASLTVAAEALPLGLLAAAAPVPAIAAGAAVAGFGVALFMTLWETTLQQQVPPDALSRVSAYDWMGSIALMPVGTALAGPVAVAVGVSTTLWFGAASVLALTALVLAVPDVRHLRREPSVESRARPPDRLRLDLDDTALDRQL